MSFTMPDKPGMLNNAIKGFNRTWNAVQARRDAKGKVYGYTFMCGCGTDKFFKVRDKYDAHAHALAEIERHKCPQQRRHAAQAMNAIARVA